MNLGPPAPFLEALGELAYESLPIPTESADVRAALLEMALEDGGHTT